MHCEPAEPRGRYPDRLQFRAPRGLGGAIKAAADRHYTSPAEWARQTLLRALEEDGLPFHAEARGAK
jgi:predicted HicB family RNase H-like nuclease